MNRAAFHSNWTQDVLKHDFDKKNIRKVRKRTRLEDLYIFFPILVLTKQILDSIWQHFRLQTLFVVKYVLCQLTFIIFNWKSILKAEKALHFIRHHTLSSACCAAVTFGAYLVINWWHHLLHIRYWNFVSSPFFSSHQKKQSIHFFFSSSEFILRLFFFHWYK